MTKARVLADYVASGVTAAEFDFLDVTSGTADATTFLRGDKTWQVAGSPSITDGGNAVAMTINSSEQIGIGDTTPAHRLAVLDGGSSEEKDVITWGRADGAATGVIGQDMSVSPGHVFIGTENDRPFSIKTHSEKRLTIDGDGHTTPGADNTQDLGTATKRWRNIHTGDLHLSNDRGNWTVIEEEDHLTLRNNKTNKIYKLVMEEIE